MYISVDLFPVKEANGKYGFEDGGYRLVIPAIYDKASEFLEELACVKLDGKYGFINPDSSWAIPPSFEFTDYGFSEGVAWYKGEGEKYGYINRDGSIAIAARYDEAWSFKEGVAVVKLGGKWGAINHDGSWAIKPMFDFIAPKFGYGVAHAILDGKEGFIYRNGTWAIPPQLSISRFPPITVNGQWQQRDGAGNIINDK